MSALKILGVLVLLFGIGVVLMMFDAHIEKKFGHRFFTKPSLIASGVAVVLFVVGASWYDSALKSQGDILNGLVTAGVGVLILVGVGIHNVIKTNLLYGIGGSLIQLPILAIVAYFGIAVFLLLLALYWTLLYFSWPTRRYY
jgi:hypothetical protein